jgi:Biotin-protein ligase, N terminal
MKPTIALFIYDPKCSVQSGNGIIRALQSHYNFKIFGKNELEKVFFDDVDMIAVPGGLGDASSYETAFRYNAEPVRDFVAQGGRYLGICMGAYWAGSHYLDILQDADAEQYIRRPRTDTRRPHAKNLDICWNGRNQKMFFYDGCALVGDPTKFTTVATYANGDAMAIRQGNIGLIGCHPESERFWYDSYSWMRGRYHGGQHHSLLLDFVDQMFVRH